MSFSRHWKCVTSPLPQLFEASIAAGTAETNVITHYASPIGRYSRVPQYARFVVSKGFRTTDPIPTGNSIWHFFVERPSSHPVPEDENLEPTSVEVYQLGNLLGVYSVDDITTAIKTTWDLLDSSVTPEMRFHEETGLLVARGTQGQLQMINSVMMNLNSAVNAAGPQPSGSVEVRKTPPRSRQAAPTAKP